VHMEWLSGGPGPFLHLRWHDLILDSETHQFYKIPEYDSELGIFPSLWISGPLENSTTLFTKTHVITLYRMFHTTPTPSAFVRAMVLPSESCSNSNDPVPLRIAHQRLFHGYLENVSIIRNSVIDPESGATNIRLLNQCSKGGINFSCIDLTLPKHPPTDENTISEMSISSHSIFEVDNISRLSRSSEMFHVDCSDDGYARGFLLFRPEDEKPLSECQMIRFSIDASGESCTDVIGKSMSEQWNQIHHQPLTFSLDCVIGRSCYMVQEFAEERELAVVVDLGSGRRGEREIDDEWASQG